MSTPTEQQLLAALALSRERNKLEKEKERIQKALDALDLKINKELNAVGKSTPTKAPAAEGAKDPTKEGSTTDVGPSATTGTAKVKAPKAPKEPKKSKPAATETGANTQGGEGTEEKPEEVRAKKGQLGVEIMKLINAKPQGLTVAEIAEATGREKRNIYVWNSNIGSKLHPGLKITAGVVSYDKSLDKPEPSKEEGGEESK